MTVGGLTTTGPLTVTGGGSFNSLIVTGSTNLGTSNLTTASINTLSVTGSEVISGPLTVNNSEIITNNLFVTGSISAGSLAASSFLNITGSNLIINNALITGSLTSVNNGIIGGTLTVSGSITGSNIIARNTTFNNIISTGSTTLQGLSAGVTTLASTTLTGSLLGQTSTVGNLTAGPLIITGSSTLQTLSAGNITGNIITATGSLVVTGTNNATFGGNLTVSGSITGTFSGSLISTGSLSIPTGSNLTIQSGSIIPFQSNASFVILSGSIPGYNGPYYAISNNNVIQYAGTDATVIFQSAFNALSGSGLGGLILVGTGSYVINSPLIPYSGITIRGVGGDIRNDNSYPGSAMILGNNVNNYMFNQPDTGSFVENFEVYNMIFDGNYPNNVGSVAGAGIWNVASKRCTFEHCSFVHTTGSTLLFTGSPSGGTFFGFHNKVINCRFTKSLGSGIISRFADENWYIDNHFSFFDGPAIESKSGLDRIDGNVFINVGTGSSTSPRDSSGCPYALHIFNIRTTVVNNIFDMAGGGGGAFVENNAIQCIINNNTFMNTDSYSIQLNGADDTQVCNNLIYNPNRKSGSAGPTTNSGSGIFIADAKYAIISNNKILDDGTPFSNFPGHRMTSGIWEGNPARLNWIEGNYISGSRGAAIRLNTALQAPINQSGSSVVRNNVGYNPVGYINDGDIQMNSSPFTYTNNDFVVEDIYLYSGSLQSVTGSGGFPYMTSGPIRLEPNQTIVITAAATPVIIKRNGY